MAISLFKRQQKTINFVFTDQVIRFVELAIGSKFEIVQADEQALPKGIIKSGKIHDYPALQEVLFQCVKKWKIKNKKIRFIIPDPHIIIRQIQVPLDVKEDELNNYLFLEMGTTIHLPFSEPTYDSVLLGKTETKQNVLLVASPEEVVQSYREILEDVKLQPIVADIGPLSLYRLCKLGELIQDDDHVMLLNLDEQLLTLSIFHDDIPIFMRPIELQQDDDFQIMMNQTSALDESYILEDIYSEVEKVMSFYTYSLHQGNARVNKYFISGDHPNLEEIQKYLENRLQVHIELLLAEINNNFSGQEVAARYTTALGLGLKEVPL